MRSQALPENCKIKAIDNSESMLKKCRQVVAEDKNDIPVEFQCINLENAIITNASIVLLNWTLQFIPKENREQVIQDIYNGLLPGGVLLLSEKILLENSELNEINIELHESFKKANGYSDLEIARKRVALDNVLIPESLSQHKERLLLSGFKNCDIWFRYFNFASLIAIK
jgi:tRNA (cmo5U34)-methyltransferase